MYTIYSVTSNQNKNSKSGKKSNTLLKTYIRLGSFAFTYLFYLVLLVYYKWWASIIDPKANDAFTQEAICRSSGGGDSCIQYRVDPGPYWLNSFVLSSQGIVMFIFFGLQKRNYVFWRNFLIQKWNNTLGQHTRQFNLNVSSSDFTSRQPQYSQSVVYTNSRTSTVDIKIPASSRTSTVDIKTPARTRTESNIQS